MLRGDIYLVDFEPTRGAEANKLRPAVLVSNNAANQTADRDGRGVLIVVPVTSNTGRVYPFQALIASGEGGLAVASKAQAEQLRAVDYTRLRRHLGTVKAETLARIDAALRLQLAL